MVPQEMDEATMSSCSSSTMETIQAMKRQEATEYQPRDYLGIMLRERPHQNRRNLADADFRTQMVIWCYNLVDLVELNRETVAIAMNVVDRFIAAKQEQHRRRRQQRKTPHNSVAYTVNRRTFQLTTLAAVYLATKVHEPKSMDPGLLANISQGAYSASEIEAAELDILLTLDFRVHPPTAMSFVRQGVELLSSSSSSSTSSPVWEDASLKETVLELARLQTEVVVPEYDFIHFPASHVAYWCLLNALQGVGAITPELKALLKEAFLWESSSSSLSKTTTTGGTPTATTDPELSCSVQAWLNGVITNGPKMMGLTRATTSTTTSHADSSHLSSDSQEDPIRRTSNEEHDTTEQETIQPASPVKGSTSASTSSGSSRDSPCSVSTTRKL